MDLVCACDGLFPLPVEEKAVSWTWRALAMGFSPLPLLLLLQLLLLLLLHPAWPSTVLDSIFLPFSKHIKCEWLKHRNVALWQAPWR